MRLQRGQRVSESFKVSKGFRVSVFQKVSRSFAHLTNHLIFLPEKAE